MTTGIPRRWRRILSAAVVLPVLSSVLAVAPAVGAAEAVVPSGASRFVPLSLPVRLADESVCVGPGPGKDSYLNIPNIIAAALNTGAEAIHPGYGFLSENAEFAKACTAAKIAFVGPTPEQLDLFGDKAVLMAQRQAQPGFGESWVWHMTAEWSQAMADETPAYVAKQALAELERLAGLRLSRPVSLQAKLWTQVIRGQGLGDRFHAWAHRPNAVVESLPPGVERAWWTGVFLARLELEAQPLLDLLPETPKAKAAKPASESAESTEKFRERCVAARRPLWLWRFKN